MDASSLRPSADPPYSAGRSRKQTRSRTSISRMARALILVLLVCGGLGCWVRQRLGDGIIEEAERNYDRRDLPVYPSRRIGAAHRIKSIRGT